MSTEPTSSASGQAAVWKIWANPIVRRYARARLRPRAVGLGALVVLMMAFFIFSSFYLWGNSLENPMDRARRSLVPLLVFQGMILFVFATGQMAAAMTAEADEGVLDYQRLAPMTPLAKVLGYLFGLPIREYLLFASTMPLTLFAFWKAQVPIGIVLQLYGLILLAGILYHLTGLLAGTVVKNRRWAFLISMGLVFLLYTVLPQAAKLGLVYFKYVTILPAVSEWGTYLATRNSALYIQAAQNFNPEARFFNLPFKQAVFTVFTQLVLIFTMIVMLWRRWHRADSHLLAKVGATGFFAWIQLMVLGNALPLIEKGSVFPSYTTGRFMALGNPEYGWSPDSSEAMAMIGAYGVITLLTLFLMILLITPSRDRQIRGWRRARKLGDRSLGVNSDPATSFPFVLMMIGLGAGGWFWFSKSIIESTWFGGTLLGNEVVLVYLVVLASGGLCFYALHEGKGGRTLALATILVGVAPVLVGIVLGIASDASSSNVLAVMASWIMGISPVTGPVFSSATVLPITELSADLHRAVPRAFWFWQSVYLLLAVKFLLGLRRSRVEIARQTALD